MKKYDVSDVIHIENDVLLYYNCDTLLEHMDKECIYIPFDTYTRNIASIMYIPNKDILRLVLDNYDTTQNDMYNFSQIKQTTGRIQNFPIFVNSDNLTEEQKFVSTNSDKFPFIFDAAAIGQFVGGVDPRNISGDTQGFVNETCVIQYNKYFICFETVDGKQKPFIVIDDTKIPIFNLHIHCKNLTKFV